MITILAHRIELAGEANLELDAQLLEWLADLPAVGRGELWLKHSYGLIGSLTGVERMIRDVLPCAAWTVCSAYSGSSIAAATVKLDAGNGLAFAGMAAVPANALLAATLRAWSDVAARARRQAGAANGPSATILPLRAGGAA